jgi:hypothetical protein
MKKLCRTYNVHEGIPVASRFQETQLVGGLNVRQIPLAVVSGLNTGKVMSHSGLF